MWKPDSFSHRFRPVVWLLLIVFAAGLFVQPFITRAIDVIELEPLDWSCVGMIYVNVDMTFTGGGEPEPNREIYGYRVTDGDGDVLGASGYNFTFNPEPMPQTVTTTLFLNEAPSQNPVTIEIIDWDINSVPTGATWSVQTESPCPLLPTPTPTNTPAATLSPDDPFNVLSIEATEWSCVGTPFMNVRIVITGGGEPEPNREIFGYRVIDGDGDVLVAEGSNLTWNADTLPPPIDLFLFLSEAPSHNPVTIEIIDWDINGVPTGATWSVEVESPCPLLPTPTPTNTPAATLSPDDPFSVISIEPFDWSCAPGFPYVNARVTFTGGGEPEPNREIFGYRVIDGDGEVLAAEGINLTWTPDTLPPPIELFIFLSAVPSQNPVTIEIIDWDINGVPTGATWSVEVESPCVPPATPTPTLTNTFTPTSTFTPTATFTHTPTSTFTPTATFTHTPTSTPTDTPTSTFTPTATFTHTPAGPAVNPLSVCWVKHWNGTGSTEWRITNPNPVPIASVPDTKVRYNWAVYNQPGAQGSVVQAAQNWDNGNPNPVNTAYSQSIRLEWYLVTNGVSSAILGTATANADASGQCL